MPLVAPERYKGLALNSVARIVLKPGAALFWCSSYPAAPPSRGTPERTSSRHGSVVASGGPGLLFVVTTVEGGGLVPTSSIRCTCRGHPGHLALSMLNGAACGLLLILGGLAVALDTDVFLPLTLLVLVATSLRF